MWTLIKREIEDNYIFFVITLLITLIFCAIFAWQIYYGNFRDVLVLVTSLWNVFPLVLIFCGLGAAQMYWDRTKKISALLATLPVGRGQIFSARVIAGFLLVVTGMFPLAAVTVVAILTKPLIPGSLVRLIFPQAMAPVFLLGFVCYCVGLQAGWTSSKIVPTLGSIVISVILISLIAIKGFGWESYLLLILLISACLARAWHTFSKVPL